ncbi:MAG: amino acid decarboxylase [Spirochaetes bacterium]|nr:MAG: amino acid decarboxylase [Spirochaetota bacterium]
MHLKVYTEMSQIIDYPVEETLDPENWDSMRTLGHKMMDDVIDYMSTIREKPVWEHLPDTAKKQINKSLPLEPEPAEKIYNDFLEHIMPYPSGNIHPRFWGWVIGTGTPMGALSELLSAAMNSNSGGLDHHSANHVEKKVIEWLKEMMGFPDTGSGILTSGCSASNLIGLTTARNTMASYDIRREGINPEKSKMTLYASVEIHSSNQKAVELLGLGSTALRLIPVNEAFQIDLKVLKEAITKDREEGYFPFCIIGAAGTTNTGAIDDLDALADICKKDNLWFHVDGAFGAWAVITAQEKHLVKGIDRADSLAFDLHKWMYMPYEVGCILVRDEKDHRNAFSLTPAYLTHGSGGRGMTGGDLPWFSDYGFQLSRGFRALKVWMSLSEQGINKYSRIIQQNIDQIRYLEELIKTSPELELTVPAILNITCFRYVGTEIDNTKLNELNKRIEIELQEEGIAVLSVTTIKDQIVLRAANTNHRTKRADFDLLVREVIKIGNKLA